MGNYKAKKSEEEVINSYNQIFNNTQTIKEDILLKKNKEEIFLYNYFNHKLRCGEQLNEKEKKVFLYLTNAMHNRYGDYFGFEAIKNISMSYSLKYPERKYNQLVMSHTLKDKKYTLIQLISSFISAYDQILFYKEMVLQNCANPSIQKVNGRNINQLYVLDGILTRVELIYHNCFRYYHQFIDGDNTDKMKAYCEIEMLVDEYKNHQKIKETINIANNLSYISLKNYTPVMPGEVGASPQQFQARESNLTEEDDTESSDEDLDDSPSTEENKETNSQDGLEEKERDEEDIEPI